MKALWLALAYTSCVVGFGWLALAIEPHWHQLRGAEPLPPGAARALRSLGGLAVFGSLAACLRADHASMAALVWVMTLAASALTVAFVLAWRPALLSPLAAWIGRSAPSHRSAE